MLWMRGGEILNEIRGAQLHLNLSLAKKKVTGGGGGRVTSKRNPPQVRSTSRKKKRKEKKQLHGKLYEFCLAICQQYHHQWLHATASGMHLLYLSKINFASLKINSYHRKKQTKILTTEVYHTMFVKCLGKNTCTLVCHNEKKCQTNGKHDKRYQRYFK